MVIGHGQRHEGKLKARKRRKLTPWEQFKQDWFEWDSWILAAYRTRIDYASFCRREDEMPPLPPGQTFKRGEPTTAFKNKVLRHHRDELIRAIKTNKNGEHINYQAFLYIFAKLCVFLIATSSGFVIADIFGAHVNIFIGLEGAAATVLKYALGAVTFTGVFVSNLITFQTMVPDVIRKIFEWGGTLKTKYFSSHFFSRYEMKLYKYRNGEDKHIRVGYDNLEEPQNGHPFYPEGEAYYVDAPIEQRAFKWYESLFLVFQFLLSALVGVMILAQTVTKSQSGMTGLLPFLASSPIPFYLSWIMGVATCCCLLGQYTFSTMEVIRKRDAHKGYLPLFRKAKDEKDENEKREVFVHNVLMALSILTFGFFVFVGMYGTSKVQAKSFVNLTDAHEALSHQQRVVAKLTLTCLAIAGKMVFTIKALGNLICLIWAASVSAFNGLLNGGRFKNPITTRNTEQQLTWGGFLAVLTFAITKSFTAIDPPGEHTELVGVEPDSNVPEFSEPVEPVDLPGYEQELDEKPVSKLYSPYFEQRFMAGSAIAGAGIRCIHEPLSRQKPDPTLLPTDPREAAKWTLGFSSSSSSPNLAKVV